MTARDWTATARALLEKLRRSGQWAYTAAAHEVLAEALSAAYAAGQADKEAEAKKWKEEARREIEQLRYRIDEWRALSNGAKHPHDR